MPDEPRFLLGYGERLTERIPPPGGGGGPQPAYSYQEAIERLHPRVREAAAILDALPRSACPENEAIGIVTLHPQSIAKSYHPQQLFDEFNLRQVGSRPVTVQPERWTREGNPQPLPSTDIFVAGKRESFERWAIDLGHSPHRISEQIQRLEDFRAPTSVEKIRNTSGAPQINSAEAIVLEVGLHASNSPAAQYIILAFEEYALSLGVQPDLDRRVYAGGLCFMPVEAPIHAVSDLARFSFLRVVRAMPRLRRLMPIERSVPLPNSPISPLPSEGPVDPDLRMAIFDGGFDETSELGRWVTALDTQGVSTSRPMLLQHGHDVTSAALFGCLVVGKPAPRPYSRIDHYRVLDEKTDSDPYELYDVLKRIESVLKQECYELFSLSIGPALPVEDDEVHAWTALLDEYLADGRALAAVAVGNNGEGDSDLGEARIQVPSDCVNALGVGAADSVREGWQRASYSAFGPGRSPGRVKPDLLHFGGEDREPFMVYATDRSPQIASTCGTSFAAPAALRLASGIRAHFGSRLNPLALKALLIHGADGAMNDRSEVGWGRLRGDLESLVTCPENTVRVIYQGELEPSQYLRALIPMPDEQLDGMVEISATFCYATAVDPQDPGSYTRSGLEVTFRPDARRFAKDESTDPQSKSFFKRTNYDSEQTLRRDAQKWDTVLNAKQRFRGNTLYRPMFDIHYNARMGGGITNSANKIRYALVVAVRSTKTDIYDAVIRAYAGRLEVLQPVVEISVRT